MKYIIGIDPGISGCLAVLRYSDKKILKIFSGFAIDLGRKKKCKKGKDKGKTKIYVNNYPDVDRMASILNKIKERSVDILVVLERQQPMVKAGIKQGAVSIFKTGLGYGMWLGVIKGMNLKCMVVTPKTWQTVLLKDVPGIDTKGRSRYIAGKKFDNQDFHRKADHNKSDACLLAYYGTIAIS